VDPDKTTLYARRLSVAGQPIGPVVEIASGPNDSFYPWGATADRLGNLLFLWSAPDRLNAGVTGQFFSGSLQPIGQPFQLNAGEEDYQGFASAAPLGTFYGTNLGYIVVWANQGVHYDVYGRYLSPEGDMPLPEFRLNSENYATSPDVAADSAGNFVVVWAGSMAHSRGYAVWGRLFRHNTEPVGEPFLISSSFLTSADYVDPRVAFGPRGTFTVVWQGQDDDGFGVFARRFAASPGAEPCVLEGGRLLCDVGRTGGRAELTFNVGPAPGETLLVGDIDGDRRDDLCFHKKATFRCDLDHDGSMEHRLRFGSGHSTEIPLLGDLDEDGRDDPCVREGRNFHCDTAHDGGRPERSVTFGSPGGVPFLVRIGISGDSACIYRSGHFLCDGQDDIAFGQPGDTPLFGDFDGDGLDDPCVYRDGRFLCDTAHDGGEAEGVLSFGGPGSVPLLVNLDGV
jgi:hypothetical protein